MSKGRVSSSGWEELDWEQPLLLWLDLPATCRGHSEACLISGRCTGPGSNRPRRTAHMSWDSLAAFASPQSSTPSERNISVSSSGVNVKTERSPLCQQTTEVQVFSWKDKPSPLLQTPAYVPPA